MKSVDADFKAGDRVRNTRPTRYGEPNKLAPATVFDISATGRTIWIRYDDDTDDIGWPETAETLEKIK